MSDKVYRFSYKVNKPSRYRYTLNIDDLYKLLLIDPTREMNNHDIIYKQ